MRALGMGTRMLAAVTVALCVAPTAVAAQEAEAPPPVEQPTTPEPAEPEPPAGPTPEELELAAATRAVASARAKLASATRRSASADHSLRLADRALVAPLVRLSRAIHREAQTVAAAEELAARLNVADAEVETARQILQLRASEVYKYGTAHRSSVTFSAVRSATGPMELARSLRDLESVFGHGHHKLEEATAIAVAVAQAVRDADLEVRLAQRELSVSERAVLEAESLVASRRARSHRAEAAWLGAARLVHQAEEWHVEAAGAAQLAHEAAAAADATNTTAPQPAPVPGPPPTPSTDGEHEHEEGVLEGVGSREQVERRQRALDRARSLSDHQRRSRHDLVCPVPGGTFDDDWHYPRSDLRRHEGTDVFAPWGTPVVTVEPAEIVAIDPVDHGGDDLGGISVSYVGPDGSRWYAAHLASLAPGLRVGQEVPAGAVIGTVGTTGNARGTPPHLHLGWYRDGVAVNPYASLAAACRS